MDKKHIKIVISFLAVCLLVTSCSSTKKEKSEVEHDIEEQMLEEKIEETMDEFDTLITSQEKDVENIVDFINENINEVGKDNADILILELEEILLSDRDETENLLKELDKNNEIKRLSGQEIVLPESRVRDVKNPELRKALQELYTKPYKIVYSKNKGIIVSVDYDKILKYAENNTEELGKYLSLMANEVNNPIIFDDEIRIGYEDFEKRFIKLEKFLIETQNFEKYEEVLKIYRDNLIVYLKGTDKSPVYDEETLEIKEDVFKSLERLSKNKDDVTPYAIRRYIKILDDKDNMIYDTIEKDILSIVNEALNGIEQKKGEIHQ